MAKVGANDDDLLFEGSWLAIRAMEGKNRKRPAKDWYEGLDKRGRGQFLAAARNLENSLRTGRPPGKRAEKVKISKQKLWELKVTPPGATPPHLRVLYRREGNVLWAAAGFTKQKNKLSENDVAAADNLTAEWIERREKR